MRIGVIDFFCGCGGASFGFKSAEIEGVQVEIIAGLDNDPHSCATFRRMIGAPGEVIDIVELRRDRGLLKRYIQEWDLGRFDKVLIIGCAPCQGFAAHRKAIVREDGRRNLFVTFTELVSQIQPDAVFMENVPDIFTRSHWPFFSLGRETLEGAGYTVRAGIFNFAGFGLPQERFRAVVMAMRGPFSLPQPALNHHGQYRTVRGAIGHLPPLSAGEQSISDPMHLVSKHRASTIEILRQVPKDGGNRPVGVGPACLDRARLAHGGYTDVYGRLAWDRPSVTITARCRTPSCGRFAHPEQNRGLSVREAALLQGFPESYQFEGPFDDKYKQIGNAVPPLVAKQLAEALIRSLVKAPDRSSRAPVQDIVRPVGPGFAVTINGIKRRRSQDLAEAS